MEFVVSCTASVHLRLRWNSREFSDTGPARNQNPESIEGCLLAPSGRALVGAGTVAGVAGSNRGDGWLSMAWLAGAMANLVDLDAGRRDRNDGLVVAPDQCREDDPSFG